jgi:starch phosphorylase
MRESMARLTPQFSANRVVREYTEQHYLPAAAAYRERAGDKGAVGAQMVKWQHTLEQQWATLHFGEVRRVRDAEAQIFEVEVYLGSLDPKSVRVELYADGLGGGGPERQEMMLRQPLTEANSYLYSAQVPVTRPATDYTVRAIPQHAGVAVPLQVNQILWQR